MKKIIIITLVIVMMIVIFCNGNKEKCLDKNIKFEYYEDETNIKNIREVNQIFNHNKSLGKSYGDFRFGNSSSTFWIRIKLSSKYLEEKKYISIYNPTVEETVLYFPQTNTDKYISKYSGWAYCKEKQDENFFYPVFNLSEEIDRNEYIYIKLYSKFTQNYKITFLTDIEFERVKRNHLVLYGLLFGVLLAVMIQNFVMFVQLNDKSYLFYLFYTASMMIYQGNLCGIYNIFYTQNADVIMERTILFSLGCMCMSLIFFRSFFETKKHFKTIDKLLKILLAIISSSIVIFEITKQYTIANFYAHNIASIGAIIMMVGACKAYKDGFEQAKLFLVGWMFMIISLSTSYFRHMGIISNNLVTIHLIFITISVQAILISTDLVKQYQKVERDAKSYEFAFLHAQIKPHFLYNTLNVISSLCRIDSEKARMVLLDLADFLRRLFDISVDRKVIDIKEELICVESYVKIEQIRFRNKLSMKYEVDDSLEFKVPPLVIQPLVENAVIHGIRSCTGLKCVTLRVKEVPTGYLVQVEDNGIGMTQDKVVQLMNNERSENRGVGIVNINRRLFELYERQLSIESEFGKGTVVSFIIPKEGMRC